MREGKKIHGQNVCAVSHLLINKNTYCFATGKPTQENVKGASE